MSYQRILWVGPVVAETIVCNRALFPDENIQLHAANVCHTYAGD